MSSGQSAPANAVKRLPWEIAEMVGAGLLGAAGTIAVLSIVSGVAYAFTNTTQPTSPFGNAVQVGPTIAEVTQRSTLWATPVMALLVVGPSASPGGRSRVGRRSLPKTTKQPMTR